MLGCRNPANVVRSRIVGGQLGRLASEPYAVAFPFGCLGGFTLVQALVLLRGWHTLIGSNAPARQEQRAVTLRYTWIGGFLGLVAVVLATAVPPWATALVAGVGGPAALAVWNPGLITGKQSDERSKTATASVPVPTDHVRSLGTRRQAGLDAAHAKRKQSPNGSSD